MALDINTVVEDGVDLVAPQLGIGRRLAKVALWALGILLGGALVYGLIWWLFLAGPRAKAKHDQVQQEVETDVAKAGHDGAVAAVPVITNNYYTQRQSEQKTQENRDAILKAAGADDPINPAVADAGRRAICMRPSAASLSVCRALLGSGPGGVASEGD